MNMRATTITALLLSLRWCFLLLRKASRPNWQFSDGIEKLFEGNMGHGRKPSNSPTRERAQWPRSSFRGDRTEEAVRGRQRYSCKTM